MSVIKLAIIGAGELGLQLLDLSKNCKEKFEVVGFFDDTKELGTLVENVPVMGTIADVESMYKSGIFDKLIIAIGYKHMKIRATLYENFDRKIPFGTLIHISSLLNENASIGEGSVLYPGCIIDKNVIVGNNVLLNIGTTVAHDSYIGNHCFIAPRVAISGFVVVGHSCFFGINSTIIDNLQIGKNAFIGAGSVVIKNIEEGSKVMGNPAKEK